jgi:hypothetical protein
MMPDVFSRGYGTLVQRACHLGIRTTYIAGFASKLESNLRYGPPAFVRMVTLRAQAERCRICGVSEEASNPHDLPSKSDSAPVPIDDSSGNFSLGALTPEAAGGGRKGLPLGIAIGIVLLVVIAGVLLSRSPDTGSGTTDANAAAEPYAAKLAVTNLAMSESSNLAGIKVTYLDGHIANHGDRTVTGITMQVLFRNGAQEVIQNETLPLTLIRMRQPYIDTEPVSAAPLKPGGEQDFRLIFDRMNPEWAGALPDLRVLRVTSK